MANLSTMLTKGQKQASINQQSSLYQEAQLVQKSATVAIVTRQKQVIINKAEGTAENFYSLYISIFLYNIMRGLEPISRDSGH